MAKNYIKVICSKKYYLYNIKNKRIGIFELIEEGEVCAGGNDDTCETQTRLIYYKQYESKTNNSMEIYGDVTFENTKFNPDNILCNRSAFGAYIRTRDNSFSMRRDLDIEHKMLTDIIPSWLNR